MKVRHAAALALVGWYLMTPPSLQNQQPDTKAAMSWWVRSETFRTKSDCQNQLDKFRAANRDPQFQGKFQAKHAADFKKLDLTWSALINGLDASRCLSFDDPQLKHRAGETMPDYLRPGK
jgi:hypothetical protein